MYQEVINAKTKRILETIDRIKEIENFYLAGGTALALQLGHRKSIDLDWFSQKEFNVSILKKDFIDLYFLLEKYRLEELLGLFDKKYAGIEYNRFHLLKSLTYFDDAESEPMPEMLKEISWEKIKDEVREKVKTLIK
jgi:hypothetical protein